MNDSANQPSERPSLSRGGDREPPVGRTNAGVAAVCSTLGCLGWIGLVPFLDSCDQGEQLARFFAVLFNEILIGVVGGASTILSLVGGWFSRRARRQGDVTLARYGRVVSIAGLVVGGLVLLVNLPSIVTTLR